MAATGTSKSQLYHYFANKDALIREVVKTQLGQVIAAQQPDLGQISSWEGLRRWCDHVVTMTRATQGVGGCPLGSLVGELAERSDSARQSLRRASPSGSRICPRAWRSCATMANSPPMPTRTSSH